MQVISPYKKSPKSRSDQRVPTKRHLPTHKMKEATPLCPTASSLMTNRTRAKKSRHSCSIRRSATNGHRSRLQKLTWSKQDRWSTQMGTTWLETALSVIAMTMKDILTGPASWIIRSASAWSCSRRRLSAWEASSAVSSTVSALWSTFGWSKTYLHFLVVQSIILTHFLLQALIKASRASMSSTVPSAWTLS